MLTYLKARVVKALDLNKNGKIDWWEVVVLFTVAFAVGLLFEIL